MMSTYNTDITQTTFVVCIVFSVIFGVILLICLLGLLYNNSAKGSDERIEGFNRPIGRIAIISFCFLYFFLIRIFFSNRGFCTMTGLFMAVAADLLWRFKEEKPIYWLFGMSGAVLSIWSVCVKMFPW